VTWHEGAVPRAAREGTVAQGGATIWLTGFSGSGKSSIAHAAEATLVTLGRSAYTLDGDNIRLGLNADLGFSPTDRKENVRRVGEVARLMADSGSVVFAPLISPYESGREAIRTAHATAGIPFHLVLVSTPLDVCEARDTKGLYAKARAGELKDFTGVSAPYEVPMSPDLVIDTSQVTIDDAVRSVLGLVTR
ncbi:MAG: adenylyl-sulfate kinase, partial [Acidimicrobiia bacterium]